MEINWILKMIGFDSGLFTNYIVNLKHQGAFQKLMIGWQRHQGVSETPKNADVICEQPLHQYAFWSKYHLMLWFLSNNRVLLKVRCVWSVSYQYHLNYVHLFTSHYPYAHCLVPTIWFLLCIDVSIFQYSIQYSTSQMSESFDWRLSKAMQKRNIDVDKILPLWVMTTLKCMKVGF